MLHIYALGQTCVQLDRNSAPISLSRKGSALLIYLAYERRQHSRELLAEFLWSDSPHIQAMNSLRTALSTIPDEVKSMLATSRYSIGFRSDAAIWMDALVVREAASRVQMEWTHTKNLSDSITHEFETALNLYQGDFLATLALPTSPTFEEWGRNQREIIRQMVLTSSTYIIERRDQQRTYQQGISLAEKMLQIDPFDEGIHRPLMRLLAQSGQRPQAIAHYVALRARLKNELGVEPDLNTKLVYTEISRDDSQAATSSSDHALSIPTPVTAFIERDEVASVVQNLTQPECRLLSVVGFGGVGKTRTALEAASRVADHFRDGVYFIAASEIDDSSLIPSLMLDALQVIPSGRTDLKAQLLDYLHKKQVLLVLDNMEHLIDGVMLIKEILDIAPQVKVLVTSREQLSLSDEWLIPMEGLPFPKQDMQPSHKPFAAVELFAQAAQRSNPRFSVSQHLSVVHSIVRYLEGHPLGIELTASWLHVMTPEEIAQQFERDSPESGAALPGAPLGQQSLKATFNHSWNLLSDTEQHALMRLAVFQASFTLEASEWIAGAGLPVIASLITKSWVRAESSGSYSLHELIRRFAYEKLVACGKEFEAHHEHLGFYHALAQEAKESLYGGQEVAHLEYLDAELPNIRAALSFAAKTRQQQCILEIIVNLERFWQIRGYVTEARKLLVEALIGYEPHDELRLRALVLADVLAISQGNFKSSESLRFELLEDAKRLDLYDVQSRIMSNLSIAAFREGRFTEALHFAEHSAELATEHNLKGQLHDAIYQMASSGKVLKQSNSVKSLYLWLLELAVKYGLSWELHAALYKVASCPMTNVVTDEAKTIYVQLLDSATQEGDQSIALFGSFGLAETALANEQYDEALRLYQQSLTLAERVQAPMSVAMSHAGLSKVLLESGDYNAAHQHIVKGIELAERLGLKPLSFHMMELRANIERQLGNLEVARQCYQACIGYLEYVDVLTVARLFEGIGNLAVTENDPQEVANLLDAAATLYETQGIGSFTHHEYEFRSLMRETSNQEG